MECARRLNQVMQLNHLNSSTHFVVTARAFGHHSGEPGCLNLLRPRGIDATQRGLLLDTI